MPSPRWLARFAIPMLVGAALVISAAIATADAATDHAYLAQLRAIGLTWTPDHDQAIIAVAHRICDDRSWAYTPDEIANDVHAILGPRGVSIGDATPMINLAESTYCPG